MEKLAISLILIGMAIIIGYGLYHFIFALLNFAGIPVLIRYGLLMIVVGIVLVLLKLIWEKMRGGDDEDVNRKY